MMRQVLWSCWLAGCCTLPGMAEPPGAVPPMIEALVPEDLPDQDRGQMILFMVDSLLYPDRFETRLQVRFEGGQAMAVREAMDTGGDGSISEEEAQAYLSGLLQRAGNGLRMRADGASLALLPHHEPEVDFEEQWTVGALPLTFFLGFVARIPATLTQPRQFHLENHLFPEYAALARWEIRKPALGEWALVGAVSEAFPGSDAEGRPRRLAMSLMSQPAPRPARAQAPVAPPVNEAAAERRAQRIRFFANSARKNAGSQ